MIVSGFEMLAATRLPVIDEKVVESLKFYWLHPVIYIPAILILASFAIGYLLEKSLRLKDYGWKFGVILAAWTASLAIVLLGEFKLGVDLSGGVNLVYEVDEAATAALHPDKKAGDYSIDAVVKVLRKRLNPSGVKELVIRRSGPKQIEIVVPEVDQGEIDELKRLITTGGALRFLIVASPDRDVDLVERAKELQANTNYEVRDAQKKVIGYWPQVDREGEGPSAPFRHTTVHEDVIRDHYTGELVELSYQERNACAENPGALAAILAERGIKEIDVLVAYNHEYDVRGEDLSFASPGRAEDLSPEIDFGMRGRSISKMGTLTSENLKRKLAIVFDQKLISAPIIQSQITDRGRITGRFKQPEVNFMVELLRSGSMPVVLQKTPISETLIGSILGEETIYRGSISAGISLIVVMLFTLAYYRFAGLVACLALILNLLLTVSIMILLKAPFTLPGLAGLVLTVGMSVDANVLIFERMREELAKGAALRMAIRNGFDRAFTTIVDSNLTTLLTAIVLYVIGTDQLKGFGVTLSLGILTSMFTAVFCARTIFDAFERLKWLKSLSMTHFLTALRVNWVKLFYPAVVTSVIVIAIGLGATVMRGVGIFDIDLAGGTTVTMVLKEPIQENPDQKVREILAKEFANLTDPRTKGKVEYSVYQMRFHGEPPGSVFKIDSSLQEIAVLQKTVQEAFRRPDGSNGLRTYQMDVTALKSEVIEDAGAASPPSSQPAEAAPPAENKATSGKASAEPPADDAKAKEGSDCIQEEQPAGKAAEAEKTGQSDAAAKGDDKAPADKGAKEKAAPPPSEPAAPAEPASPAPAPAAPETGADAAASTTFKVKFPGNKITATALEERILDAASATIDRRPDVTLFHPERDPRENEAFDEWQVTIEVGKEKAEAILANLEQTMEQSPVWQNSSKVSGQVTQDMQFKALTAVLVSLLGIAAYVWFRFQNLSWGIAAIVSLLHDTLIMLGGVAISFWLASALGFLLVQEFKISLTVIAAFLTLIGYSINDTIVIFDRIREIRGKSPAMTGQMINDAVNQTMSRTILTTGTVLMVVVILYIWGGEGIHTFAFCMLIGCLSGTYSTVFIAAPLLLWLMGTEGSAAKAVKPAPAPQPGTAQQSAPPATTASGS